MSASPALTEAEVSAWTVRVGEALVKMENVVRLVGHHPDCSTRVLADGHSQTCDCFRQDLLDALMAARKECHPPQPTEEQDAR